MDASLSDVKFSNARRAYNISRAVPLRINDLRRTDSNVNANTSKKVMSLSVFDVSVRISFDRVRLNASFDPWLKNDWARSTKVEWGRPILTDTYVWYCVRIYGHVRRGTSWM